MEINNETTKLGLCQDARFLLGLSVNDTASYSTANLIRNINSKYRRVNSKIWESSGTWEYDDSNWTSLPIATADLTADQQDYELPSTAQKVDRLEVLDNNGNYQIVYPFDKSEIQGLAMSEFYETAGFPVRYDLVGRSIMLYPKPATANITATAGIKVYFSRDIDEFAVTDTNTEPGFVSNFHRLLSLGAAYDWALSYNDERKIISLRNQIESMNEELQKFYGSRHRDMPVSIIPDDQSSI